MLRWILLGAVFLQMGAVYAQDIDPEHTTADEAVYPSEISGGIVLGGDGVAPCWNNGVEHCKSGEVCRFDMSFEGNVAKNLYNLMLKHGVQKDLTELLGVNAVTTVDDLITCFHETSSYRCHIAYDVPNNKTTSVRICE